MSQLRIQPIEFRNLLIEHCEMSKDEANDFVKMKMMNQFGEIKPELAQALEEECLGFLI